MPMRGSEVFAEVRIFKVLDIQQLLTDGKTQSRMIVILNEKFAENKKEL